MSVNFNMHDVVRGAITTINDDTAGTVYVSTSRTASRGILTPTFTPVSAQLQVQAQAHDPLRHTNSLEYTGNYFTVYAYGNFSDLERPDGTGGDVCNFNGRWYYIETVLEWWPQWCCFEIVRQLNAADIATLLAQLKNGANPT